MHRRRTDDIDAERIQATAPRGNSDRLRDRLPWRIAGPLIVCGSLATWYSILKLVVFLVGQWR